MVLNPVSSMKRQKDRTLKEQLPRSIGAQYATGNQWKNNSRKNGETEPQQKQHPVVDVSGDGSKDQRCKEHGNNAVNCMGTWNLKSVNLGNVSGQTGDGKS